jgi:hypothetical protein
MIAFVSVVILLDAGATKFKASFVATKPSILLAQTDTSSNVTGQPDAPATME